MKIKCVCCDCELSPKHVYGEWDDYCSDCWESEGRDKEHSEEDLEFGNDWDDDN